MAQPASPSPPEFQPYRKVQGAAERELAAALESAAKAIRRRVKLLSPGVGGQVRKAQFTATLAAIRRVQSAMWTGPVSDTIARGVVNAEKAAESAIEAMTRVAYTGLPDAAAEALVRGLSLSAQSGLVSDAARRKRELSTRVYHDAALANGKIEQLIRQGLIQNLTAKELADDVYQYVSPTAKGGASYAAMRLARTEINNAFHERQLAGANRPGVSAVKWNLSGSHRVPDLCNEYASHGGNGHWGVGKVPEKPHPQCFCYLTYITEKPADFKTSLARGDYDDEIDRRTRENMARLGQKVGKLEPTVTKPKPKLSIVKSKPQFDQKGYKPKSWSEVVDNQEDINVMLKSILKLVPKEQQAKNEVKDGPDWASKLARQWVEGDKEQDEVKYSNGPHRIRFSGEFARDREAQQQFLQDFDAMQQSYPTGHDMHISVAPPTQFETGVGGETTISTGSMFINEKYLAKNKVWAGMPVSKNVSAAQYILAHEWGHSLSTKDEADEAHTHDHAIDAGGMTHYGTSDHAGNRAPREGYAEAFAEWSLSKGKTSNPAALVYAKKFKWGERFGIG